MRKITLSGGGSSPVKIGKTLYASASEVPAKVLLTATKDQVKSPQVLAHLTREVLKRHAAGKLADSSMNAAAVKAAVQAGNLPTSADARKYLDGLAEQRKQRAAARKKAANN